MAEILYNQIKSEYDDFYKSLLKTGKLPLRATEKGFWGSAVADEVFEAFKKINLQTYNKFLDIGSGDGKVVLIASLFVQNAVGIEIDKELYDKSLEIKEKIGIKNANFFLADFFNCNFSEYDVLFCNPDEPIERKLEAKLIKEMEGILIFYGSIFPPKKLKKEMEFEISGTNVGVYRKV